MFLEPIEQIELELVERLHFLTLHEDIHINLNNDMSDLQKFQRHVQEQISILHGDYQLYIGHYDDSCYLGLAIDNNKDLHE
jgi:hypothetical protein